MSLYVCSLETPNAVITEQITVTDTEIETEKRHL